MESKDLLHPENDANQDLVVNSGASVEDQNNTELVDINSNEMPIEEPVAEEPVAEEPIAEEPIAEEPVAEEPIAEEPIAEEPIAEEPIAEEPIAEEPVAEEPVAEELVAEEPVVEEPVAEEPVAEEPVAEEPAAEEPVTEEPIAEGKTVNEIVAEIESSQVPEEDDDDIDDKTFEESPEKIESEYSGLTFEESVDILHEIVQEPNFNIIKLRVGILKSIILQHIKKTKQEQLNTFINEGGNQEEFIPEKSDLEKKFENALQTYKENKAKFLEKIEVEKNKNFEAKKAIIEDLKNLIENESNLKTLNDKFKEFQDQWKEIGPVPQNESTNLWQNYHFYVEKFFDILKIGKELRSLDLKKNLEQKIKLCETAESLLLDDSINKSFKKLQQLHDEWKEIGPVPEDKKDEIWERFKVASDQINQKRREHYDEIFAEQQNNYNAKVVLCEQAEELVTNDTLSIKEYNAISDKLNEVLKVWKTLGPAPAKLNDEIWNRFKVVLDKFYGQKKEYFQQMKDSQMQNYNLKLNLAIQAEALSNRNDWKNTTDEILKLQKEWKNIGPTPRKYSEAVWKRFSAACDHFFEEKSFYFSNIQQIESDNLKKKEELIQKIINHEFSSDKAANLDAMKLYQREWTELGHVPKNDKDRIYNEYRDAVNKRFADLKVSVEDIKHDNFKSKIDTILNNPNAERLLDKEMRFLSNKLTQLKEDINLWENNLGFFANSKNADLLKAEFNKKIESAKEEAKELEFKIRTMKIELRNSNNSK